MKIELGPGSKILGTKRVSAKGQISGLTEHAGSDVMVVLVSDESKSFFGFELPHEYLYKELQKVVEDQMAKAFEKYQKLGETFKSPADASKEFLKKISLEALTKQVSEDLNKWLSKIVPDLKKND